MKYFIGVIVFLAAVVYSVVIANAVAAPIPSVNNVKTVVIPVIKGDDGRYWEAEIQCNNGVTSCLVVYVKEICKEGDVKPDGGKYNVTDFSPSFCWEFGR